MTRFLVSCPHVGCAWRGRLRALPGHVPRFGVASNVSLVAFDCPRCHGGWHARVIGDDVEALPDICMDDEESAAWPLIDIGAGG